MSKVEKALGMSKRSLPAFLVVAGTLLACHLCQDPSIARNEFFSEKKEKTSPHSSKT
jgi:hypothetical protein